MQQAVISKVDLSRDEISYEVSPRKKGGLMEQMEFSSDGSRLVARFTDRTIGVFDAKSWEFLLRLKTTQRFGISCMAVSPDNQHLATGTYTGKIHVWNFRTGENVHTFQAHTEKIKSLTYNHDGSLLITGGVSSRLRRDPETNKFVPHRDPDLVRIWQVGKWVKRLGITEGMEDNMDIHSLDISRNCQLAAVGAKRNSLRLYDASNGQLSQRLPVDFVVKSVQFSPDGNYLAAVTDFSVFLWKMEPRSGVN